MLIESKVKLTKGFGIFISGQQGSYKTMLANQIASRSGFKFCSTTYREIKENPFALGNLCENNPGVIIVDEVPKDFDLSFVKEITSCKELVVNMKGKPIRLVEPPFFIFCGDLSGHKNEGEIASSKDIFLIRLPAVMSLLNEDILPTFPAVELGPDGIEWAKTEAGYEYVEKVKEKANGFHGMAPWFYGWAVREAFVAGALWQEKRGKNEK